MEAALDVFCRQGFERSQVADVAKAMGVAVGTIYLYVESKEALFDLVVRHTASEDPAWLDALEIPVRTPAPGATLAFLRETLGRPGQWPCLAAALARKKAKDPRTELLEVLREQYQLMRRHRAGLLLLTRSALEFPGLVEVFVFGLRNELLSLLERYILSRAAAGQFRQPENAFATAGVLIQTIAWANLQRPFDPGFRALDETSVENAVLEMQVHGLLA
jgi:AcrR family transcriptional regulator